MKNKNKEPEEDEQEYDDDEIGELDEGIIDERVAGTTDPKSALVQSVLDEYMMQAPFANSKSSRISAFVQQSFRPPGFGIGSISNGRPSRASTSMHRKNPAAPTKSLPPATL